MYTVKQQIEPVRIINITLGNEGEDDEVKFEDIYNNSHVMFCNNLSEIANDLSIITKYKIIDFIKSNIFKCDVYEL